MLKLGSTSVRHYLYMCILVFIFGVFFALNSNTAGALEVESSPSDVGAKITAVTNDTNSRQDPLNQPLQAVNSAVLQADQIKQSLLSQFKNDDDLIVGTYDFGSLQGLRLTKQQAEIIKNGYIPILGKEGDTPIVNSNPKTNVEYAEIDGGSGGRSITACYDPNVPRIPGENQVLVKGTMYGSSNGGYVCVDAYNIRYEACAIPSEQNPCLNGTYQLDNNWLLSIGVDTAAMRSQIDATKNAETTLPPTQPSEPPDLLGNWRSNP